MLRRVLLALFAGLVLTGCGSPSPFVPSPVQPAPTLPARTPSRVVIISVDGLRPDAVQQSAPNMLALAARGSYSWRAQTILPSNTLPAHMSMLTGYSPDVHGISWDDYLPARGQLIVPSIFSVARAKGLRTEMVVGKEKFMHFRDTGACDTWILALNSDDDVAARAVVEASGRPNLLFVHLPQVDLVGHASQWMSAEYLSAVARADQAVGRIVGAAGPDAVIIVTSDHGGHPTGHGTDNPVDTTIPWIIAGPGVAKGRQLNVSILTVDTAATAAYLLGVTMPPDAIGRPVVEAFTP